MGVARQVSHFSWVGAYLAVGVALLWIDGWDGAELRRRFAALRAATGDLWPIARILGWLAVPVGLALFVALWPAVLAARATRGRFRP